MILFRTRIFSDLINSILINLCINQESTNSPANRISHSSCNSDRDNRTDYYLATQRMRKNDRRRTSGFSGDVINVIVCFRCSFAYEPEFLHARTVIITAEPRRAMAKKVMPRTEGWLIRLTIGHYTRRTWKRSPVRITSSILRLLVSFLVSPTRTRRPVI